MGSHHRCTSLFRSFYDGISIKEIIIQFKIWASYGDLMQIMIISNMAQTQISRFSSKYGLFQKELNGLRWAIGSLRAFQPMGRATPCPIPNQVDRVQNGRRSKQDTRREEIEEPRSQGRPPPRRENRRTS